MINFEAEQNKLHTLACLQGSLVLVLGHVFHLLLTPSLVTLPYLPSYEYALAKRTTAFLSGYLCTQ